MGVEGDKKGISAYILFIFQGPKWIHLKDSSKLQQTLDQCLKEKMQTLICSLLYHPVDLAWKANL